MKHIMMLFLSEVHLNRDGELYKSYYKTFDGKAMMECVQTNESAVRLTADALKRQKEKLDSLFYFSTNRTKEKIKYKDKEDQEKEYPKTHEKLFLELIEPFTEHCQGIDYDEQRQTSESLRQVFAMADAIRTFMEEKGWKPEEVELHADFTGGFRHASMMMLSVMQLLKYRGIRTTAVLYSNRNEENVENVTDIYRMFNLISGADEFINFGSTREIMSYMEGAKQTSETKILLQRMRDFTNAVRICRTGKIAELAKKLQEALKNFEESDTVSLQEGIFLRILAIFKLEYGSLLKENFTNLDIIRWCVEKGYLQQAMTLCTEWLPSEIVKRRIFCPSKEDYDAIKEDCEKNKNEYQTWQYHFLIRYTTTAPKGPRMNSEKVPPIYPSEKAWRDRQRHYLKMIEYGVVQYWKPSKAALEILHDYFRIRAERNNINHANAKDTLSTKGVETLVLGILKRMESRS